MKEKEETQEEKNAESKEEGKKKAASAKSLLANDNKGTLSSPRKQDNRNHYHSYK